MAMFHTRGFGGFDKPATVTARTDTVETNVGGECLVTRSASHDHKEGQRSIIGGDIYGCHACHPAHLHVSG